MTIDLKYWAYGAYDTRDGEATEVLANFFRSAGLYNTLAIDADLARAAIELLAARGLRFDAWCVACKRESTFSISPIIPDAQAATLAERIKGAKSITVSYRIDDLPARLRWMQASCARNGLHSVHYVCRFYPSKHKKETVNLGTETHYGTIATEYHLCKIGQTPSPADIAQGELHKYVKALDDADFRELTRAVGLVTHDVGIGSFVYLRRILERLVNEAGKQGRAIENFERLKTTEKIDALGTERLPEFLVRNAALHSILSKGIHELEEAECLAAFNACRVGIELILDEHIAAKSRKAKIEAASRAINDLNSDLKREAE